MNDRHRRDRRQQLLLALVPAIAAGCAASPENPADGSCTLDCSKPHDAAYEYQVSAQSPFGTNITLNCDADFVGQGKTILPANGPVEVKFQIIEPFSNPFPNDRGNGGATTAGGTTGGTTAGGTAGGTTGGTTGGTGAGGLQLFGNTTPLNGRPVAGVGFEPFVQGLLSVVNTAPEFKVPPGSTTSTTVSSFKYQGIVTPSAEWCSDSCGVMSYEFWPDCLRNSTQQIVAGVAAGPADNSQAGYTFNLTNVNTKE
jgi:hypothetical protein